jgi:hypothetical protein
MHMIGLQDAFRPAVSELALHRINHPKKAPTPGRAAYLVTRRLPANNALQIPNVLPPR